MLMFNLMVCSSFNGQPSAGVSIMDGFPAKSMWMLNVGSSFFNKALDLTIVLVEPQPRHSTTAI
jgi:hypothetical protein